MASSELRKRKAEEYEMQLFNFHSRAVYATLQSIVHERIHSTIDKMCETIKEVYHFDSKNVAILKTNQKQLEKLYYNAAMLYLKSIEIIVNKYIAVPCNVLLEEDKYQKIQYSATEFDNMKQRLEELQQRAKRATILNALLKEESHILEQLSIPEDNLSTMYDVIADDLKFSDANLKIGQLVDDYNQLSAEMFDTPTTDKAKYNTVDNLKCKDFDLNSL